MNCDCKPYIDSLNEDNNDLKRALKALESTLLRTNCK